MGIVIRGDWHRRPRGAVRQGVRRGADRRGDQPKVPSGEAARGRVAEVAARARDLLYRQLYRLAHRWSSRFDV